MERQSQAPMWKLILKEKEDEIKHKDFCVDEFNTNELQTEKKERSKQDLTAKIEDLDQTIKALTEAIDKLKAEIAEMQVQMKRAGEDREKENKETVFISKWVASVGVALPHPLPPPPPPPPQGNSSRAAGGGVWGDTGCR